VSKDISGVAKVEENLRSFAEKTIKAMVNGVTKFARTEMVEMKKRTPVDTGELQDSGYVKMPRFVSGVMTCEVGFWAPHALWVHEDLEAFHRVGEAKFMESVWKESAPYFLPRVTQSMQEELGL